MGSICPQMDERNSQGLNPTRNLFSNKMYEHTFYSATAGKQREPKELQVSSLIDSTSKMGGRRKYKMLADVQHENAPLENIHQAPKSGGNIYNRR